MILGIIPSKYIVCRSHSIDWNTKFYIIYQKNDFGPDYIYYKQ